MLKKNLVASVIGANGSGKAGVRDALVETFDLIPVEMSHAIKLKHKDSSFSERFPRDTKKNYPDEAVEEAFTAYIDRYANNIGFVIDGAPRSVGQVHMLREIFNPQHYNLLFLHLVCPRHECEERVRGRRDSMMEAGLPVREEDRPEHLSNRLDEHFGGIEFILTEIGSIFGALIEVDARKSQEAVLLDAVKKVNDLLGAGYSKI